MSRTGLLAVLALMACAPADTDLDAPADAGPIIPNPLDPQPDQDGDTIIDGHDGMGDPDRDRRANFLDEDSDGDGLMDRDEAGDMDPDTPPVDSDVDGTPDFLDLDSDGNCIGDRREALRDNGEPRDTDGDGAHDAADMDNDGDGIDDVYEIGDTVLCQPVDTDDDAVPDFMDEDSDGDGILDFYEAGTTDADRTPDDTDGDGQPDFRDLDSDDDGMIDALELGGPPGSEPRDTDEDGLYDFKDADSDDDGLSDRDEVEVHRTDPYDFDTDGDGFPDGVEATAGSDPRNSNDGIDGLYVVVPERDQARATFSFFPRIQRLDIALVVDTTGSMGGTISAVQRSFVTTLDTLGETYGDVAGGAAEFDDYNFGAMGAGEDKPFVLGSPITTDDARLQAAIDDWRASGGSDGPEGATEAIYQAITGAGYDQNCDGDYDEEDDVLPYLASRTDPFEGDAGEAYDPEIESTGLRGGMGFREFAYPVIIYATDNVMRHPSSPERHSATPGGCPLDADFPDVAVALNDLGGTLIGLNMTGGGGAFGPAPEMERLARLSGSLGDFDGDGVYDDPLVFSISPSPTFDADFADRVKEVVEGLVGNIHFGQVSLNVPDDEYGFLVGITPDAYEDPDLTEGPITFDLTFNGTVPALQEDQTFVLTLQVLGDDMALLDERDLVVVVPARE